MSNRNPFQHAAWFYKGNEPLFCVMADISASEREIRAKALKEFNANVGIYTPQGMLPEEVRQQICRGKIRY